MGEKRLDLQFADYVSEQTSRTVNRREVYEDLKSWFSEALVVPNDYDTNFENGKWVDRNGASLVSMSELALLEASGSVVEDRFRAELRGVEGLERIIASSRNGDVVLLMSPPGSAEEGFGRSGRRLSYTYIGVVADGQDRRAVKMYAVPAAEIEPRSHFHIFENLIEIPDDDIRRGDIDDRSLVSRPFILKRGGGGFNKFARSMGYESFRELISESEAINVRRIGLIEHTTDVILEAVEDRDLRKLRALNDVVRKVYALEASSQLEDLSDLELKRMFDVYLSEVMEIIDKERNSYFRDINSRPVAIVDDDRYWLVREMQRRLYDSARAIEILSGGACPTDQGIGLIVAMGGAGLFIEHRSVISPYMNSPMILSLLGGSIESPVNVGGEKQCYKCPKCTGNPRGDVYKKDGYLVCSENPNEHKVKL